MNYTVDLKPRAIKDDFEAIKALRVAKSEEAAASTSPLASVRKELKI